MAIESSQITAACVEATEFPDLVRLHRVSGVPKTVATAANGATAEVLGAVPEAQFVDQILQALDIF